MNTLTRGRANFCSCASFHLFDCSDFCQHRPPQTRHMLSRLAISHSSAHICSHSPTTFQQTPPPNPHPFLSASSLSSSEVDQGFTFVGSVTPSSAKKSARSSCSKPASSDSTCAETTTTEEPSAEAKDFTTSTMALPVPRSVSCAVPYSIPRENNEAPKTEK